MTCTFQKAEKLCGQTRIGQLYHHGKRFVVWPLRVTYLPIDDAPTEVLVWAPKSLFKHAVDRNRLRRRMREAYRLNKHILTDTGRNFQVAFNYMEKDMHDYHVIDKAMRRALKRLSQTDTPAQ